MALCSIALTIHCYMRCPFGDEWAFIDDIARGKSPLNAGWLFSQHNEHRLAIPRLLTWLDVVAFRAENISLFVEIWLVLIFQWAVICYALERFTDFPKSLKRTLEGLFAFCIFHMNQQENLTWAFQIGFVLAFAIATTAMIATIYFWRFRRPSPVTFGIAFAPVLAAFNVSGALLLGPVVACTAIAKRVRWRFVVVILAVFALSSCAYVWHFQAPDPAHPPQAALAHPKALCVYILTYFGASWTMILRHKERPIALLSLVYLGVVIIRALRMPRRLSDFEWFCLVECCFIVLVAFVTALARLQYGAGQAFASRYQTPAMLYWAALGALAIFDVWRARPARFPLMQAAVILLMLLSVRSFPKIWRASSFWHTPQQKACVAVINGTYNQQTARTLYAHINGIEPGASFLRRIWGKAPANEH